MRATATVIKPEFIPARAAAARYSTSLRTIDRWLLDDRLGFPAPVYLGRMRFWRITDLEAWEAKQSERSRDAAA
jgi:predicted DNA-binding transcriptional regulator AlpA